MALSKEKSGEKRGLTPEILPQVAPQPGQSPALLRTVLDRVADLTSVWGPYQSYVAVLTIIGVCSLQLARADSVLPITTLTIAAMLAPLVGRLWRVPANRDDVHVSGKNE